MEKLKFEELKLSKEMHKAIEDMGFEEASPIQSQAIPYLLEGKDVIGQAQTGTGKTAAFGIPILEMVDPHDRRLQAVVLCPTRELAVQVSEELRKLSKYKHGIRMLPIYGGQPIDRQIKALKGGVHIIIGTPGRVMDHMNRRTLKLESVKMVVLDEADEMLDMGFREDIELILSDVPKERQTALFSATMPKPIMDLTRKYQKLSVSSSIIVEGVLVSTPGAKQPFEIKAEKISIEGESIPEYPLQKKKHSFEFLRTIAHLRPRSNTFSAVFRVRSLASFAVHKFFQDRNFVYVHTPIITGSDCEGAGEMFRITTFDLTSPPVDEKGEIDHSMDFFGRETSLTVSGQLTAEAYALAFRNVYTFGPTFRAENSNTARHAAEFWMIEPEIAFAELADDMELAEGLVKYVINHVMENAKEEMEFFNSFIDPTLFDRLNNVVNSEFGHVTYTEAVEMLKKSGKQFEYPVEWGIDLQTEHERYLTEEIFKKPVFVTNYPKDIKAFYMRMNDDDKTVAAMDLLVPGVGEIIGGSQREERPEKLEARMHELELNPEDYWWYLELRKYGGTKHAGFGLGFERIIMYITGMSNIRDVIPFPRTTGSAEF